VIDYFVLLSNGDKIPISADRFELDLKLNYLQFVKSEKLVGFFVWSKITGFYEVRNNE